MGAYGAMLMNAGGSGSADVAEGAPPFGTSSFPSGFASQAQFSQQYSQHYGEEMPQYSRQAFTPPNALSTPLPERPATSYLPVQQPAVSAAPTPVPGMRPYTAPGRDGEEPALCMSQRAAVHDIP